MLTDSRLKLGTLTIDTHAFTGQATNVQLVPSTTTTTEGDRLELLDGNVLTPTETDTTTWSFNFTGVQDFDNETGWIEFARANAGDVIPVVFKPNATGPSYDATVRVRPVAIGGGVNVRLTSDAAWPVVTGPTPTYT